MSVFHLVPEIVILTVKTIRVKKSHSPDTYIKLEHPGTIVSMQFFNYQTNPASRFGTQRLIRLESYVRILLLKTDTAMREYITTMRQRVDCPSLRAQMFDRRGVILAHVDQAQFRFWHSLCDRVVALKLGHFGWSSYQCQVQGASSVTARSECPVGPGMGHL